MAWTMGHYGRHYCLVYGWKTMNPRSVYTLNPTTSSFGSLQLRHVMHYGLDFDGLEAFGSLSSSGCHMQILSTFPPDQTCITCRLRYFPSIKISTRHFHFHFPSLATPTLSTAERSTYRHSIKPADPPRRLTADESPNVLSYLLLLSTLTSHHTLRTLAVELSRRQSEIPKDR